MSNNSVKLCDNG